MFEIYFYREKISTETPHGSARFETEAECIAQVERLASNTQFAGKPERWVMVEEASDWDISREDTSTPREMRVIQKGEPERQVEELDEEGNPTGEMITIPAVPEIQKEFMKVKADYRWEIVDLSTDIEYQKQEVLRKRLEEYPSQAEILEAMLDGGIEELQEKRIATKDKYPFPDAVRSSKVDIGWQRFRKQRDDMLISTDFTQLADAPFDSTTKADYRAYRKYLRDLPAMHNDSSVWDAKVLSFSEWKDSQV